MRVFWLGMHKLLVKTELPRLRKLGYEVYCPPYLHKSKQHQSSSKEWDAEQPTTLPKNVFSKISTHNFFYNEIPQDIADLINEYFDLLIVTIDPAWLIEVLKAYKGPVIYRTYGHVAVMSEVFWQRSAFLLVAQRQNFFYCPHALEAASHEQTWLKKNIVDIPYVPGEGILSIQGKWSLEKKKSRGIMLMCPNLANSFYKDHFIYLKNHFPEDHFKFYGVQLTDVKDPQIVGTLPEDEYLDSYLASSGFLYTYRHSTVCFLPPIEMMIAGGPVIFLSGSLLDQYFKGDAPGRATTEEEAKEKCLRLLHGDTQFINEILESQRNVVNRYLPEHVWPIFDKRMKGLISPEREVKDRFQVITPRTVLGSDRKRIYVFMHFPGHLIRFKQGEYFSFEGIIRVVRQVVRALLESKDVDVVLTCRYDQLPESYGYFKDSKYAERIWFLPVDKVVDNKVTTPYVSKLWDRIFSWGACKQKNATGKIHSRLKSAPPLSMQLHIRQINEDDSCHSIFVPHYYLFEDAKLLHKKLYLYLPDYTPHFFEDKLSFGTEQLHWEQVGFHLSRKASRVLTNSQFSKSYLPKCQLKVVEEKIQVVYLPNLNRENEENPKDVEIVQISDMLKGQPFLFYPTQARPNKNLPFLIKLFDRLKDRNPYLKLILTCEASLVPESQSSNNSSDIYFYHGLSDNTLAWLYRQAACLPFTSGMEGNFPPQVYEALTFGTPIVATEIPLITERLKDKSELLLLCEEKSITQFTEKIEFALNNQSEVLKKQQEVLSIIDEESNWSSFSKGISNFFE